jgi:hypothetical protein
MEWVAYTNYEAYDSYKRMLHWRGSVAYNSLISTVQIHTIHTLESFLIDVKSHYLALYGIYIADDSVAGHRLKISVAAYGDCSGPHKSLF